VQVLTHHDHGLHLALAPQDLPDGFEGPLAPEGRLQGWPDRIVERSFQQAEERRERGLTREVQVGQLAGDLVSDRRPIIPLVDAAVAPQEVHDGAVGGGLRIGERPGLEHPGTYGLRGADKFRQEPRLADAGFTDDTHHLALACSGPRPYLGQDRQLPHTAHKGTHGPWRQSSPL
jgi:hypothetical protein